MKVIFLTTRIKYGEIWGKNHMEASIKALWKKKLESMLDEGTKMIRNKLFHYEKKIIIIR